tara:strand:- start:1266 stop:1457 length:192 start_codon:yes stop_codon:yes gene_type:complete
MAKEFNILKKIESIDRDVLNLKKQVEKLQMQSHPPREFVRCETCKQKVKENKQDGQANTNNGV